MKQSALDGHPRLARYELLRLTASLERSSEHPLAAAIVRAAYERNLSLVQPSSFDSPIGKA